MIVVTSDTLFEAVFNLDRVVVSVMAVDSNRQQVSWGVVEGDGEYLYGEQVTISASASEGFEFRGWMVDGTVVSTESSVTFPAVVDVQIEGLFAPIPTYVLTLLASGNGTIRVDGQEASSHEGAAGGQITIEAIADPGNRFVGWSNGQTDPTIYYTMTHNDDTLTAYFEPELDIEPVDSQDIRVGVRHNQIIVYGAQGRPLTVYDLSGRRLLQVHKAEAIQTFMAPASGIYLIRSGNEYVNKVVVTR